MILLLGILLIGVLVGISLLAFRGDESPQSVTKTAQEHVDESVTAQEHLEESVIVETSEAACASERATIEVAQEAFRAVHGQYASDTDALVESGLLRRKPTQHETAGSADDFHVTAIEDAGCD